MKKILYTSIVAVFLLACANSKSVEDATVENKSVDSPTVAVPQPMLTPNGTEHETVDASDYGSVTEQAISIEWLDFETAIDRNEKNPKYIFIDIYTEWCGWCKRMDNSTFIDPAVVRFINENCYAVKMDAEMKGAIAYKDKLYEYKQVNAKSGYNSLAISLLDSQMSFPSFVILDKKETKRGKIMGYKTPQPFLSALKNYVK